MPTSFVCSAGDRPLSERWDDSRHRRGGRILCPAHHEFVRTLRAAVFLILPALVSALSGYALGALLPQPEPAVTPATPAPRRRDDMPAFVVLCVSCGKIVRRPHPFQTTCDKCKEAAAVARAQQTAVTALSMWRAMLIGAFLHSFSTVVVALLVSHGVPMLEAGRLMSLASILSLLLLPLLIPYAKHLTALLSVTGAVLISLLLVTISQEFGGEFAPWGGRRYVGGQESDGGAGAGDVASAMDDDHGSSAFPKPFIDDVARRARDDKHVSALALAAGTAALAPSGSAAFAHVAYSSASSTRRQHRSACDGARLVDGRWLAWYEPIERGYTASEERDVRECWSGGYDRAFGE